jgi:hypothetical protein
MNRAGKSVRDFGIQEAVVSRRGAHWWAPVVEEWAHSGLRARAFCAGRGLSLKTFEWWRWALRSGRRQTPSPRKRTATGPRRETGSPGTTVGFLEVLPAVHRRAMEAMPADSPREEQPTSPGVEVVVRRGKALTIRVDREFDAGVFRRVVQLLEEVAGC